MLHLSSTCESKAALLKVTSTNSLILTLAENHAHVCRDSTFLLICKKRTWSVLTPFPWESPSPEGWYTSLAQFCTGTLANKSAELVSLPSKRFRNFKFFFHFLIFFFFLASDSKREKEAGMGIGYIILIALAVFGFVLGVVTLLIFQYQRKTGRYNLRIKSDNFSYQVFYD